MYKFRTPSTVKTESDFCLILISKDRELIYYLRASIGFKLDAFLAG